LRLGKIHTMSGDVLAFLGGVPFELHCDNLNWGF
jgi:hypothetical protein